MLEEQMYREAERFWAGEDESVANLRFSSLDVPFQFFIFPETSRKPFKYLSL